MSYSVTQERVDSFIRFFLYLLIFWLPYSPAVVESCVVICLILWVVKRAFICKNFQPPRTFLNKPIIFFLTVCIFSVIGSAFWLQSLSNFLTKTLEWFIVYFFVSEAVTERKHVYIILGLFLFTLCATVLDSLIQYYFTSRDLFLGHVIEPATRATAGFKTPNGLGAYLTLAVPLIFASLFLTKKHFYSRLLSILIFLLTLWSLVVTFSRGAWLAAFAGGAFFFLAFLFHKRLKEFYFICGVFLITFFLSGYLWLVLTSSFDLEASTRHSTVDWRINVWGDALTMIQDRPLFGHGINTFMQIFEVYRTDRGSNPTYAHNCYIQLAAETGAAGLISFLWIIFEVFRKPLRDLNFCWNKDNELVLLSLGLLSGIFAFLIHSFSDNNFYSLQLSVYLWFMIGILAVMTREMECLNPNGH